MDLMNFLDPKLLPKLLGNPLCTDNYEAVNLISNDYCERARGFIAYSASKPPVEIELRLLCNVNISYIVINSALGNQKCTGIEILAKNSEDDFYTSIAKAFYDAQGVIFCNSKHYSAKNPPSKYNSNFALSFLNRTFLNASFIKVVILRTQKSVPCLAGVEVWGKVSSRCSAKTAITVKKLLEKAETKVPQTSNTFVVPDEFKDDLTFELMTIPYTLPCGKTIDLITLEKHIESEESFARKPCDPFTGKKFSKHLKPILNVALKSRIDMFKLQHGHKIEQPESTEKSRRKRLRDDYDFGKEKPKCISCGDLFEYIYQLPCQHEVCRPCLVAICEKCLCSECNREFVKSDVVKIDR